MSGRFVETLEDRRLLASAHFAVIGDYGQPGAGEADVAAMVKGWNPDFIITLGDNSYQTAAADVIDTNIGQYYHEFIYNYHGAYGAGSPTRRFYPAVGNHDWGNVTPGDLSSYLDYFDLPGNERYFDFVAGPVHFFVIDSDGNEPDGNTQNSAQALWLKNALASATEPHKLVYFHHPPYSSGASHGPTLGMRWPFEKWGATAVLSGHEHDYERLSEQGIPYFVNGVGGAELAGLSTAVAGSQLRYNADFGAMLVDATDTTIQYRFYNRTGALIDNYSSDVTTSKQLLTQGSDWKYLDNGSNQGTAWRASGFADGSWLSGPAQLGYGDGDEATTLSFGPNSNAKFITTYFRKSFTVANRNVIGGLNLSMLRDDGAVVYLNGAEVFRSNMPAGTISFATPASTAIGGGDEGDWYAATINPNLLAAVTNTLAVEIHQSGGTSSDISFDLSLTATGDFLPPAVIASSFNYSTPPTTLQFQFSESVSASLSTADLLIENLTAGTTVPTGDISLSWNAVANTATFSLTGLLPDGRYRAALAKAGITDAASNALAADFSMDFFFLAGDANHDAIVDVKDFAILAANLGTSSGFDYTKGDFNLDGVVDPADLGILASRWQTVLAPAASLQASVPKMPPTRLAARSPAR